MQDIAHWIDSRKDEFENALCDWLRIPSVSTDPAFAPEVRRAADWLAARMNRAGLKPEVVQTGRHPIVVASTTPVPGAPVVLVYGHYDVQPPDPLDEWTTPPFEPSIRDGKVFARGATDDKGQCLTHLLSTEAWLATRGNLPVQLKFLIEGEEECGSGSLQELLAGKYDQGEPWTSRLAADIIVVSDSSQYAPGRPAVTYGLRGLSYFEVRLTGPSQDLHSGMFGGAVTNPANALTRMLATLIDSSGRIQVPGFYDDVIELAAKERAEFAALGFDEAAFRKSLQVDATTGEAGYSTTERRWARPTFDINGLWSGYQGEGSKTVLPAKAGAKFSFRLVPNQDPVKIEAAVREHLKSVCPPGIRMEIIARPGAAGSMVPLDSPYMAAAGRAIAAGFGAAPVFIRGGGSIPIVNQFKSILGCDTLLLGWGQEDDNLHSPNEKFSLADFHRGTQTSARLWDEISRVKPVAIRE